MRHDVWQNVMSNEDMMIVDRIQKIVRGVGCGVAEIKMQVILQLAKDVQISFTSATMIIARWRTNGKQRRIESTFRCDGMTHVSM